MDKVSASAPVVDCHAHVFTRDLPLRSNAWTAPAYDYTPDDYLADLDRHGVHFGVLSGLSIAGAYNDYTIAAAKLSPRLRATAIVDPDTDPYTMRQMRDDGVVGVRFQLVRQTELPDFTDEAHRRLLRRIRDLDWHVHVALEGHRLPPVLAALEASGVRIVLDHFAHPEPDLGARCVGFQAALAAVGRGRTWIKLSAGFRLGGPDAWVDPDVEAAEAFAASMARELLSNAGPERLLWGSDAPFVGYEGSMSYDRAIGQLDRWMPDPVMRRALSDTALRFYFS